MIFNAMNELMYVIELQVNCCGANGYLDYRDRYAISPPEECRRHGINNMGGSYYEEGCAEKFSIWVKVWAGCTAFVVALVFFTEVNILRIKTLLYCHLTTDFNIFTKKI